MQVTLRGGCDIGCDDALTRNGVQAYNDGSINDVDLDRALIRLFSSLIRLGYFDPAANQPYRQYGIERVNTVSTQTLSLRAARESIVLLKNAKSILPLSASAVKSIALIGPNADDPRTQWGSYYGHPCTTSTPLTALSAMPGMNVTAVKGVDVNTTDKSDMAAAIDAAKAADVIIYVGGINATIEGEGNDRNTIDLPGLQLPLIQALEALGKPLVVILMNGGGVDVSYLRDSDNTNAILWAGYPSQSGGDALVDVLFGRYSPAGRLPVTWYEAAYVDQVPMTDQSMRASSSNPGRTYKFYTGTPVYPFGYGLSYSTFSYQTVERVRGQYQIADLIGSARRDDKLADVALTVNVTNTGTVVSDVVVLAYVSSNASFAGVTPPMKELFDFAHLHSMDPKQSEVVTFGLSYRVLSHIDEYGHAWLLPGTYVVKVQNEGELAHTFELVGEATLVEDFPAPGNPPPLVPSTPASAPINKDRRRVAEE